MRMIWVFVLFLCVYSQAQDNTNDRKKPLFTFGAIADVQPSFVPTDADRAMKRIAPSALQWSYAWRTLLESGVHCAGSSDAPVETCDPLVGIRDAMFRRYSLDGGSGSAVFRQEETLTFAQALHL